MIRARRSEKRKKKDGICGGTKVVFYGDVPICALLFIQFQHLMYDVLYSTCLRLTDSLGMPQAGSSIRKSFQKGFECRLKATRWMDVFSLSGRLLKGEICRHIEPNESFVNIFQDRD